MKVKDLENWVGKLSSPSKMPGLAWGIPTKYCQTGGLLRQMKGSVCSICYASKGRYVFEHVKASYQKRYEAYTTLPPEQWVSAMAELIGKKVENGVEPYFRWFDSGDLQGSEMLEHISEVCVRCPTVNFWLPTKEKLHVKNYLKHNRLPDNLVVRVSATKIDDFREPVVKIADNKIKNFSFVQTCKSSSDWRKEVEQDGLNLDNQHCPAPLQEGQCGTCRMCWNRSITSITYKKH